MGGAERQSVRAEAKLLFQDLNRHPLKCKRAYSPAWVHMIMNGNIDDRLRVSNLSAARSDNARHPLLWRAFGRMTLLIGGAMCLVVFAMSSTALALPKGAPPAPAVSKGNCSNYPVSQRSDRERIGTLKIREELGLVRALAAYGCEVGTLRLYNELLRQNPSDPDDREIETELARTLSWNHQYGAAIRLYQKLLSEKPDDRPVLEGLANVYAWSGKLSDSLSVEKKLLADEPSNVRYQLQFARLEISLHQEEIARKVLTALLKADPLNREAHIDLARLDLKAGRLEEASDEYEVVLGHNFQDPEALYGAAEIDYYKGDLHRALPLAANLVDECPKDFDALLLLARIQRALHKRKTALVLLDRASQLRPNNTEAESLRKAIREESSVTIHTSSSYGREVSTDGPLSASSGALLPARTVEDLNTYGAATRVDFAVLPQSSSYIVTAITPSNSPMGGIQGAVAPAEFMYGQATQVLSNLTVRGGIGLVRMGPGDFMNGNASVGSVGVIPVGYAGVTLTLSPKLKVHFTASQTAITYTPTSTSFGVRQRRLEGVVEYRLDLRTRAQLRAFHDQDFSSLYYQTWADRPGQVALQSDGHDSAAGEQLTASRELIHYEWMTFEFGYEEMILSYAGQRQGVYMGFFNPAFYQQHLITTQFGGELWGPLRYSFTADAGLQQANEREPFTAAEKIGPGLTLRMTEYFSVRLGYIHYNFAQSLGNVKGNVVQFSTDYRF
jgi:tetratricopeptide (TPR) repeat protein